MPYKIRTVSGETYEIPHPDFILVPPKGSYVVVIDSKDPKEAPNHISTLLIECATPLDGPATTKDSQAVLISLQRHCVFLRFRDSKRFDLFFNFVCERCRPGAVYDTVIECQRKRDDLGALVLVFVRN